EATDLSKTLLSETQPHAQKTAVPTPFPCQNDCVGQPKMPGYNSGSASLYFTPGNYSGCTEAELEPQHQSQRGGLCENFHNASPATCVHCGTSIAFGSGIGTGSGGTTSAPVAASVVKQTANKRKRARSVDRGVLEEEVVF
ncbi:unnamed protein product, partial [Amoebophrya sp. A120]